MDERALESVRARVRRAWTIARLAFALECAAVGAFAASAVLAVAGAGDAADARIAAALVFGLAAATYGLETAPRRSRFLRAFDERLGHGGALATVSAAPRATALVRLLAREVAARSSSRDIWRALGPRTLALLALPVVGVALVAETRDAADPAETASGRSFVAVDVAVDVVAAARTLSARARTALEAGSIAPAAIERIESLARRLEDAAGDRIDPATAQSLARELESAARDARPDAELAAALDRARFAIQDAPGADGEPRPDSVASDARPGSASADRGASGGDGTRAGGARGAESGASALAADSRPGTMAGSPPDARASEHGSSAGPRTREAGVGTARWWPERFDAVVERWVAARGAPPAAERR